MIADLPRTKLNRARPMRDQIYVLLRNLVITGAIKPGETIDEKRIAAKLNISRTPVREAVKKLSDENLVDVVAQSGTRAARIDKGELHQAYLIRRALEMESAAQAAPLMTEAHRTALQALVHKQSKASADKQFLDALSADDQFHHHIAGISNLPRLWRAIEISKAHLDRCRLILLPQAGQAALTLKEHEDVIAALVSKDAERARMAMGTHLKNSYEKALTFMDAARDGNEAQP